MLLQRAHIHNRARRLKRITSCAQRISGYRRRRKLVFKRRSLEPKLDHSALKRDEEVRKQFSKRVAEVLGVVDPNADAEKLEQQLPAAVTSAAKATLPEKLDDDSE